MTDDGTGGGTKSLRHLGLSLDQQREVIKMLAAEYPIAWVCAILGCSRSSYYHLGMPTDKTDLEQAIDDVAGEWPTYGSRRVTAQLRRHGWAVNRCASSGKRTYPTGDAPERVVKEAESKGSQVVLLQHNAHTTL